MSRNKPAVMVVTGPEATPKFIGTFEAESLAPGLGEYTCCLRGHTFNGRKYPCDKIKVAAVVRQMLYAKAKAFYHEGLKAYSRILVVNSDFYERGLKVHGVNAQCMQKLTLQPVRRVLISFDNFLLAIHLMPRQTYILLGVPPLLSSVVPPCAQLDDVRG